MTIRHLRKRIDALDRKLVKLLSQRARCSLAVGRLKRAAGLPLFHRKREQEISRNVRRANPGPLPDSAVDRLFVEILRLTRAAVRAELRRRGSARADR